MEANIVAHFIHGKITADSVSAMQLLVATHEAEHQFDQLKPSVFFHFFTPAMHIQHKHTGYIHTYLTHINTRILGSTSAEINILWT